jgi:hypothetical protein
MSDLLQQGDQFIRSDLPATPDGKARVGRGQNGDSSASSTTAKSLPIIPNVSPPAVSANVGDWQTRNISAEPIKPAHGMASTPGNHLPLMRQMHRKLK